MGVNVGEGVAERLKVVVREGMGVNVREGVGVIDPGAGVLVAVFEGGDGIAPRVVGVGVGVGRGVTVGTGVSRIF